MSFKNKSIMIIKDKITQGEWYSSDHHIRVDNKTGAIGMAYVAQVPSHENKFALDKEGIANAKLWAASKEMLNILERIIMAENTAAIYEVKNEAIDLLEKLNQ